MSDETQVKVTVYDCAHDEVAAVLATIREHLGNKEFVACWTPDADRPGTLVLGEDYRDPETQPETGEPLAHALIACAPGATFTVTEEGSGENAGRTWRYTPDLGEHEAEADLDGDRRYSVEQILAWVGEYDDMIGTLGEGDATDPLDALRALMRDRTGETHQDAMRVPETLEGGRYRRDALNHFTKTTHSYVCIDARPGAQPAGSPASRTATSARSATSTTTA